MARRSYIYSMERTPYGAWAIYGIIGERQYLYYTKAEARKLYNQAVREKIAEYMA